MAKVLRFGGPVVTGLEEQGIHWYLDLAGTGVQRQYRVGDTITEAEYEAACDKAKNDITNNVDSLIARGICVWVGEPAKENVP